MRKWLWLVVLGVFLAGCYGTCHIPPGQIKNDTAPGQVMHDTGYNPASGKVKCK
jgi:hypothetical protein